LRLCRSNPKRIENSGHCAYSSSLNSWYVRKTRVGMQRHPDHWGNRERYVRAAVRIRLLPAFLQNADRRETLGNLRTRETPA
jgi:hypothetical protein